MWALLKQWGPKKACLIWYSGTGTDIEGSRGKQTDAVGIKAMKKGQKGFYYVKKSVLRK